MKTKFDLSVAVATTVFMMVMSIMPVRAQFLYRDNHIFAGPRPSDYTTVATDEAPGLYLGPIHSIEYWDGGINFWCPPSSGYYANYKLFVGDDGKVGVGRKPTTYKLEVAGQVWTTAGLLITSDATQKKNVKNMDEQRSDYVTKLRQLQGKIYDKLIESSADNAAEVARMVSTGKISEDYAEAALAELNARRQDVYRSEYGFIAQDVQALFPELVEENEEGILAINYTGLIPVLLEAIKDLQDRVTLLEQGQGSDGGGISIRSAPYSVDEDVAAVSDDEYLSQNAPNPIDGSTVIRYHLPEGVTQATIAVYSTGGSVVKIFPLDAKAKSGSITLSASDLARAYTSTT